MTAICGMGGSGLDLRAFWESNRQGDGERVKAPDGGRGGAVTRGERFGALDLDHDGALTGGEFRKALEALAALTGVEVPRLREKDLFSRLDGNGDGRITLDEFRDALAERAGADGGGCPSDRSPRTVPDRCGQARAGIEYLSRNSCGAQATTASVDARVSTSASGISISVKIAIASCQGPGSLRG